VREEAVQYDDDEEEEKPKVNFETWPHTLNVDPQTLTVNPEP
jgi:hypothetical protein